MKARSRLAVLLLPAFVGLTLLWLGLWFSLVRLGLDLPDMGRVWPFFPLLAGVFFLVGFAITRAAFLVLPGSLLVLSSLFFFPFGFGLLDWSAMARLWPVFPLIVGMSFLGVYAAGLGRRPGLLVPSLLLMAIGIFALGLTATPIAGVIDIVGWPVALLVTGALLLLAALLGGAFGVLRLAGRRSG